nr:MAG TPA: hypothetical protein [Caudoviricetes sp.]
MRLCRYQCVFKWHSAPQFLTIPSTNASSFT